MAASRTNSISSNLTPATQTLALKAFESIQSDFQTLLQESNEVLRKDMGKVVQDMTSLKQGMKSMQSYIEYMHREAPYGKKKIEEFEERLRKKDEEIEHLKTELERCNEEQSGRIEELEAFKAQLNGDKEKDKKNSDDEAGNDDNSGKGSSSKGKKSFEFQEKVEGKNVMIANDVAAISEGGPMSFVKPLEGNDPNSLLNKDAEIPTGSGGNSLQPAKVDVDGTLIGNDTVNIQTNVQKVFLGGPKEQDIEVNESGEKIEYREADAYELTKFLDGARENAEMDEDNELIELRPDEELQQRDVIVRVADLIKKSGEVEHFIRLCGLLTKLSERQLRSLAKDLGPITRIDLTNIQIDYKLLSAFFRCFKNKRFHWLLLRFTRILANDMRMLSSALGSCKILYLDLGNCSFEYMSFFELASVLNHVDNLILRGLTSAKIVPENAVGAVKDFSADEAQHLADSISRCPKQLTIDLSQCDLRNVEIVTALSKCMDKVISLSLQQSILTEQSMIALLTPAQKLQKLDLACAELRSSGVKGVAAHIDKANVLILSSVLLDDEGVEPLVSALEKLPEKSIDVLDISCNPISSGNVSKFLKIAGKVKFIIFSKDQITSHEMHSADVNEQVILSEVVEGNAVRLSGDAAPENFTHWVACSQPVENEPKMLMAQATSLSPRDIEARALKNYRCSKCKTHIAFARDAIPAPCANLLNDRRLWGVLENPYFTAVTSAVSCIPGNGNPKKHTCGTPNCGMTKFKMRGCKCAVCKQTLGGYYSNVNGQRFWCLYQEAQNSVFVGTSKQSCKQM